MDKLSSARGRAIANIHNEAAIDDDGARIRKSARHVDDGVSPISRTEMNYPIRTVAETSSGQDMQLRYGICQERSKLNSSSVRDLTIDTECCTRGEPSIQPHQSLIVDLSMNRVLVNDFNGACVQDEYRGCHLCIIESQCWGRVSAGEHFQAVDRYDAGRDNSVCALCIDDGILRGRWYGSAFPLCGIVPVAVSTEPVHRRQLYGERHADSRSQVCGHSTHPIGETCRDRGSEGTGSCRECHHIECRAGTRQKIVQRRKLECSRESCGSSHGEQIEICRRSGASKTDP